jgi:predicted GH43/DUF377 family glycosyl hydrolase
MSLMKTTTKRGMKSMTTNKALVEVDGRRGTVVGWCEGTKEVLVDFGAADEWVAAAAVKLV